MSFHTTANDSGEVDTRDVRFHGLRIVVRDLSSVVREFNAHSPQKFKIRTVSCEEKYPIYTGDLQDDEVDGVVEE